MSFKLGIKLRQNYIKEENRKVHKKLNHLNEKFILNSEILLSQREIIRIS